MQISYGEFLKGYDKTGAGFAARKESPGIRRKYPGYGSDEQKHQRHAKQDVPVMELQSNGTDYWVAIKSMSVAIPRTVFFTHYLAVDGEKMIKDQVVRGSEEADRLRCTVSQIMSEKYDPYFLNRGYFDAPRAMENGFMDIAGVPEKEKDSWEMGCLIMLLWRNCWIRHMHMTGRNNAIPWECGRMNDGSQELGVLVANESGEEEPLAQCRRFFTDRIAPLLPPALMSIISITLGAMQGIERWQDSACKVYSTIPSEVKDQRNTFNFSDPKKETSPYTPDMMPPAQSWLAGLLAEKKLPSYFAEIDRYVREKLRDQAYVQIRADFNLLAWCAGAEYLLEGERFDYVCLKEVCGFLVNINKRLRMVYRLTAEQSHQMMRTLKLRFFERCRKYMKDGGQMKELEYSVWFAIYKEIQEIENDLAVGICEMLAGQPIVEGKRIADREEIRADRPLYVALLREELKRAAGAGEPDVANYRKWLSVLVEMDDSELVSDVKEYLGEWSAFRNEDVTPRELVDKLRAECQEKRAVTQVRLLTELSDQLIGKELDDIRNALTVEQYRQWADCYTDLHNRRQDKLAERVVELLGGQIAFAGEEITPLQIASEANIHPIIVRQMEQIAHEYYQQRGQLTFREYTQLISFCKDADHWPVLNDKAKSEVQEMLSAQDAFTDSDRLPEELLEENGCEAIWLALLKRKCQSEDSVTDERLERWVGYLHNEWVDYDTFLEIGGMLSEKMVRDRIKDTVRGLEENPDARLKLLYEQLLSVLLQEFETSGNRMIDEADYRAWTVRLRETRSVLQQGQDKGLNGRILEMLKSKRVRGEERGARRIARMHGQWDLLAALCEEDAKNFQLQADADYAEWAYDYVCLGMNASENDWDQIRETIERNLLAATWRTDRMMTIEAFENWLNWLSIMANAAENKLRERVYNMIAEQYELRNDKGGVSLAASIASEHRVETQLLMRLVETEYQNTLARNDFAWTIDSYDRWVAYYSQLKAASMQILPEVRKRMEAVATVENKLVLQYAIERDAGELEEELVRGEWEQEIRYRNEEDYRFRLNRYFGQNKCAENYFRLLTERVNPKKGFVWLLKYLADAETVNYPEHVVGLFGDMAEKQEELDRETTEYLRDYCQKPLLSDALRRNQSGLGRLAGLCARYLPMCELKGLYTLLNERVEALDEKAAGEVADAIAKEMATPQSDGENMQQASTMLADYVSTVDQTLSERIRRRVENALQSAAMTSERLKRLLDMSREIRLNPEEEALLISGQLEKTGGCFDRMDEVLEYISAFSENIRLAFLKSIGVWMRVQREQQQPETLAEILHFAGKQQLRDGDECVKELYAGVKAYIVGGMDCTALNDDDYEQLCRMFAGCEGLDEVILVLFENNETLSEKMKKYLAEGMTDGPVELLDESRFSEVAACRNELERQRMNALVEEVDTLELLQEWAAGDKCKWISEASFARVSQNNESLEKWANKLLNQETVRLKEMNKASYQPWLDSLTALCEAVDRLNDYLWWKEYLAEKLEKVLEQRIDGAYEECCEAIREEEALFFDRLKYLTDRLSEARRNEWNILIDWCKKYIAGVRNKQDRGIIEVMRQTPRDRRMLTKMDKCCSSVYDRLLKGQIVNEWLIFAIMAAAKVMNPDKPWEQYIRLALQIPSGRDIWVGNEDTVVVQTVVHVANQLKAQSIQDDAFSGETLAEYCRNDKQFERLAKRTAELKELMGGKAAVGIFGRIFGR